MHAPIPEPSYPGIRVSPEFRLFSVRFNADELIRTPLSNRPWTLYRVPADQIEPIDSDWKQISLAPGIHVAGKSDGTYRVAIDDSYVAWLLRSKFKFQPDFDPLKPVDKEVSAHGERVATRNAVARFHRDAFKAIFSRKSPQLDSCYRNLPKVPHQVALEWAILKRDMILHPEVKAKSAKLLLFIILNLVDAYDTPLVLDILRKDEDQLLDPLWNIYSDPFAYLPRKIANLEAEDEFLEAQNAAELHRLSLFRLVGEFAGAEMEVRQHRLDLGYTANYNHNILGSIISSISGSKPFGTFAPQKMLDALSKSPVFPDDTISKLDVIKLSAELMSRLPIGLPDGYLDLPFDLLSKLTYGQVQMIRAQMLNFYRDRRSLETPENNILVLLTWNPIRHMIDEVLVEWTPSVNGWRLYERLIKSIQVSQPKEQLVLTLAALLCYQRLFPPTMDTNQPIKGSYQADFDAILNGERLSNARTVFEYMAISVLRAFHTVKDEQKMRIFLASVLDKQQLPVLERFHEFSDQYWVSRLGAELAGEDDGLSHEDAHKMVETVIKMVTLDNEEEQEEKVVAMAQESGVTTTDERWALVRTAREEDSVASLWVSNDEHRVLAFPRAVFHLEEYKLIYVSLPKVPPHEKILSTISLPNGSWAVIVLGSYVSELERDLDTVCSPYNVEPSMEDVKLLGLVEAQNRQVDALARMAIDAMLRDNALEKGLWVYLEPRCVFNLFTTWLGGVVTRSKRDSPAFSELTIENDPESGRIQLDGYDFDSYTLVRVSDLGHYAYTPDKLGNFDEILSIEELDDGSWEFPVRKSYLPTLKDKLREVVSDCIIDPDYDPTKPSAREVEEFGYVRARILKKDKFHDRAKRMIHEAFPKAAAFYAELAMGGGWEMAILDNNENEMDILGNEEQEDEESECWVMVQRLRLQSPVV